jgi:protein-S-isoprenylcysteine O-methyltransferase Ste14
MTWWIVDSIIIASYGLLHTLLTTKPFRIIYDKILPAYTWNIVFSGLSVLTIFLGFEYWQSSGEYVFYLIPGTLAHHLSLFVLASSLFFFFYCFKFTTSFWQWLGVKQVALKAMNKKLPDYYVTRRNGIKKYVRFPHHTCLIFFFWAHPVMTTDTLLLALGATAYLYLGTYHQDLRGLSILGDEWAEYRKKTALLIPGPMVIKRMIADFKQYLNSIEGASVEPDTEVDAVPETAEAQTPR